MIEQQKVGNECPLWKEPCHEHKCKWYVHILGAHPQKPDTPIDHWGCAVEWIPIMLVENGKNIREVSADVQSFRNRMAETAGKLVAMATSPRLPDADR